MKILIPTGIFPPDLGGPASYVPKIAKKIINDGHEPIIITYSDSCDKCDFDNLGYEVYRIKRSKLFLIHYIKYFFILLKLIPKADFIFLQDYFSAGIPTFFANIFYKKKLFLKVVGIFGWEQGTGKGLTNCLLDEYVESNQGLILNMIKKIEYKLIHGANEVIVPSNYLKNILVKFGIKGSKIKVVYNSFDTVKYNIINKDDYKKELGLSLNSNIYLSVGRLVKWKNLDKVIMGFKNKQNSKLIIIGEGPEGVKLKKLVKENNLSEKIIFTGGLNKIDLYDYYQITDYLILISTYEGMSHTLLEAMFFNIKIFTSNIAPNIETVKGYEKVKIIDLNKEILFNDFEIKTNLDKVFFEKFSFENLYKELKNVLGI